MSEITKELSVSGPDEPTETDVFQHTKRQQHKDPRGESLCEAVESNLCPHVRLFSFPVLMAVLITGFFLIQILTCGINMGGNLLEVKRVGITAALEVTRIAIFEHKHIFKLFLSWMIHRDFPQLFGSVVLWVIWGSWAEPFFGPMRSVILFVLTTFSGYLFGSLFLGEEEVMMGASIGITGLLSAGLGFCVFHWHDISRRENARVQFYLTICMVISISMLFASSPEGVLAELGASLSGIFAGMFLSLGTPPKGKNRHAEHRKIVAVIGVFAFSVFLLLSLILALLIKR